MVNIPYGCFIKWWYPQNTPKWSFLVGKPMVVGYHHFRKPPYIHGLFGLNHLPPSDYGAPSMDCVCRLVPHDGGSKPCWFMGKVGPKIDSKFRFIPASLNLSCVFQTYFSVRNRLPCSCHTSILQRDFMSLTEAIRFTVSAWILKWKLSTWLVSN